MGNIFSRKVTSIPGEHSISELIEVSLGGYKQWIYIRGVNRNNPVLLMLHGGPGAAQIGLARKLQEDLEKHFVVVNWDQRGAGLSYSKHIPKETMTIQQFVDDTNQLSQFLCKYFNQNKIYLHAHSWGTIIGILAAYQQPELYKRYFGIAQISNYLVAEKQSYTTLLEMVKKENNEKAYTDLLKIGSPPWNNLKHDRVHQKYMEAFGGGISRDRKLIAKILKELLLSKEYTMLDLVRHVRGQLFSMNHLQEEMKEIDFNKQIKTMSIPVYFCMGRHDLMVPSQPTKDFFNVLEAKEKHWIWFEESAHSPHVEEEEKFNELLIKEIQKDI